MEKTETINSTSHFQMSFRDFESEFIIYLLSPFAKQNIYYITFTGGFQVGAEGVLGLRAARLRRRS